MSSFEKAFWAATALVCGFALGGYTYCEEPNVFAAIVCGTLATINVILAVGRVNYSYYGTWCAS